ncbi:hypothetical protein Tco_0891234 [Tanacetum coccineum]|uniref:Uncharacterized protein n=1 Tax=Tanacetum coccineum TaxID=301880 RepID=A0ABQ5C5I9_9ASTR
MKSCELLTSQVMKGLNTLLLVASLSLLNTSILSISQLADPSGLRDVCAKTLTLSTSAKHSTCGFLAVCELAAARTFSNLTPRLGDPKDGRIRGARKDRWLYGGYRWALPQLALNSQDASQAQEMYTGIWFYHGTYSARYIGALLKQLLGQHPVRITQMEYS